MFGVFRDHATGDCCAVYVLVGCFSSERLAQIALARYLLKMHWQTWTWSPKLRAQRTTASIRPHVLHAVRRDLQNYVVCELPTDDFLSTNSAVFIEVG